MKAPPVMKIILRACSGATSGANVVHCPRSNMKLASGACPVAALRAAGVNVALGTDGAASNNRLDMWSEIESAALLGKLVADDAAAVPAMEVLEMATLGAARALGLADVIGSLAPGKAADMICVEIAKPNLLPVYDPISHLVYAAGREHVTDVWVAVRASLREVLEAVLAGAPEVRSIIPGVIRPVRDAKGKVKVRITVPVQNGWKAIALSAGARQELFISTPMTKEQVEAAIARVRKSLEY